MACSITITSVTGIPATPGSTITSAIHVTGTLSGECKPTPSGAVEIIVEVRCGSNTAKDIATPDFSGNWSVDVKIRCTCGGDVEVIATCATDPNCIGKFGGNLNCEGTCPTGSISVLVGDCNPDGTRNVTLTAIVTSVPPGAVAGQFDYGDGTFSQAIAIPGPGSYPDPGAPHHYAPPGPPNPVRFLWVLPANCPPLTTTLTGLQPCQIVCPNMAVQLTASAPGACNANGMRTVTLNASVSGGTPQFYHWDFGDGATTTIMAPNPPGPQTHDYAAPGTSVTSYTAVFTVTSLNGACVNTATTTVNIPGCQGGGGGGGGGGDGGNGEGFGCKGLRWAGVIAAILAALSLYICLCVPGAGSAFCYAAAALAALSAILLGIWFFFCPKPCGAALLLSWQIALGSGIGALYFAPCCPVLWLIGAGLIAAALAGLLLWRSRCKRTLCQVLAELAIVITVVILTVLGWIAGIPFLSACLNPIVAAAVSTLSAAIALGLANCASH
jgi:hypothetical protein